MSDEIDQSEIGEALSKIQQLPATARKFWRTKRAVDRGVALYDFGPEQREKSGYYGPWKFNAIQTALSGALASIAANLVRHPPSLGPHHPPTAPPPPEPIHYLHVDPPELQALIEKFNGYLDPFLVPILTTCVVYMTAYSSFREDDAQLRSYRCGQARTAYLYFDGAYGLISQLLLAFVLALKLDPPEHGWSRILRAILDVAVGCAFVYQAYVTFLKIPRKLFALNGYGTQFFLTFPLLIRYWGYHVVGYAALAGLLYTALQETADLAARGLFRVQTLLS